MAGRFSPKKANDIIDFMKLGAGQDRAALLVGLHVDTVRRWIRRGEQEPNGKFGKFARDVQATRAKLLAGCEQTVFTNAIKKRDSSDAKWVLSKLAPDEYGDKHMIEVRVRNELQALLENVAPHFQHESTFPDILQAIAKVEGFELAGVDDPASPAVH